MLSKTSKTGPCHNIAFSDGGDSLRIDARIGCIFKDLQEFV
jgi:hypothetical protein